MAEHFNTAPGWMQTREEVEKANHVILLDFMVQCTGPTPDDANCLACYALTVLTAREQKQEETIKRERKKDERRAALREGSPLRQLEEERDRLANRTSPDPVFLDGIDFSIRFLRGAYKISPLDVAERPTPVLE